MMTSDYYFDILKLAPPALVNDTLRLPGCPLTGCCSFTGIRTVSVSEQHHYILLSLTLVKCHHIKGKTAVLMSVLAL